MHRPSNSSLLLKQGGAFQGVSFDLWGTLLTNDPRTKPVMFEAYHHLLGLTGVPLPLLEAGYRSADKFTDLINTTTGKNYGLRERLTLALTLVEGAGYPVSPGVVEEHFEELSHTQDRIALELPPRLIHPSIPSLLKRLQATGVVTAVASNTGSYPASLMEQLLERVGLTQECFSCYIYSDKVDAVKPFPEFFTALLEALGTPPEATFHVGDNPRADCKGAEAAGMIPLLVDKTVREGEASLPWVLSRLVEAKEASK